MHREFQTKEQLIERLKALPEHTVYGQLTGRDSWGDAMMQLVPEHMRHGFIMWVAFGRVDMLGHFMRNLLSNDLMGAFSRADSTNLACMRDWVMFLHNYAPSGCYGSPEKVVAWKGLLFETPSEDDI